MVNQQFTLNDMNLFLRGHETLPGDCLTICNCTSKLRCTEGWQLTDMKLFAKIWRYNDWRWWTELYNRKYKAFISDVSTTYNCLFYCKSNYGGTIIGADLRRYS